MATERPRVLFFNLGPNCLAFRQSMFYQSDRLRWRCKIRVIISADSYDGIITIGYYRQRGEYERCLAAIDSVERELGLLEASRVIKHKCAQIATAYNRVLYAYHPDLIADSPHEMWAYVNTLLVDRHVNIKTKHECDDGHETVLSNTMERGSLRAEKSLCDRLRLDIHAQLRMIGAEFLEKIPPGVVCSYACTRDRD